MADRLEDLLRSCTVRVTGGPMPGAGFFVAPGKLLTCVHVIGDSAALVVRWERDGRSVLEAPVTRRVAVLANRGRPIPDLDCDYPDIAVLQVDRLDGHPCVRIDPDWPSQGDIFQIFGYPEEGGAVRLTPARLTYRGTHGTLPTAYLDLASDTIKPGMSGAAVLNLRSGAVCGVVVASKHPSRPDGALAIPWSAIAADLSAILDANSVFHATDKRWEEAAAVGRIPAGGVPVGEVDLRRLGVHAAISVPGVPEEVPPEYVPRDADAAEFGVRAKVAAAAQRGGFVLLVGGSSAGKTRCAVEAVKALLPEWWLVHPAGPAEVAVLAQAPAPRMVVWLDELQRYLDGEHGLTGGLVRALLNAPSTVVIISTLWPDRYDAYTALPEPGEADLHAREREVLDLAAVIRISGEFSPAETDRARAAAARDPRVQVALAAEGYGLTQTLAAAPQLVARWEAARDTAPYGWAVLTAALDAARLGARAPLGADFLRAAAPGYCTPRQQAEAPGNWFEQALAYATKKLHGAAAALAPAGAGMRQVAGYTMADYLLQHASRERRIVRVPASTWDALLSEIRDPGDAVRLAVSAEGRLLYRYAIPLYRHAVDAGDQDAARRLADLLARRGDWDEAVQIRRGRADNLESPDTRWASKLAQRGDLDGLRTRAADYRGDDASRELASLLARRGNLDELRARADDYDPVAAGELADLLADRGDLDELRARARVGDVEAAERLARLLAARGDLDELRARARVGDVHAAERLADRGDLDELRALAHAGDVHAASLLAYRGELDELRALADAGDEDAAFELASPLARRENLDELRARAAAGDVHAASPLADLLADRSDLDELRARADAGDWYAAQRLASLLADRSDLDELRARADAGDWYAAQRLASLLASRWELDEAIQILHALAGAGTGDVSLLPDLLIRQGRVEEAERLRRFGLTPDGSIASR